MLRSALITCGVLVAAVGCQAQQFVNAASTMSSINIGNGVGHLLAQEGVTVLDSILTFVGGFVQGLLPAAG